MNRREFLLHTPIAAAALAPRILAAVNPNACYELRIYTIAPGKREALLKRFRDHTLALFRKHGIESIGYWLPIPETDDRIFFLLRYPDRAARDASWKAFVEDPEWQAAYKASEAQGTLVTRVENPFLVVTDYSPEVRTGDVSGGGVFELRTYTTPPGRLAALDSRFRDHTVGLFAKHGMKNYAYFHKMPDQPEADVTLLYFLTHASEAAARASFDAFRQDPVWVAARGASEQAAGGSLTVPDGVKSLFLLPADFSPTR
ncbi:MAG: NIPSNAP family protein [Verrucomicrobiae bacterium]|nr:NIPSNAP family protein [Verrucomicrobiae bacterium]